MMFFKAHLFNMFKKLFQGFTIELGWKQKIAMLSVNTDVTDSHG